MIQTVQLKKKADPLAQISVRNQEQILLHFCSFLYYHFMQAHLAQTLKSRCVPMYVIWLFLTSLHLLLSVP